MDCDGVSDGIDRASLGRIMNERANCHCIWAKGAKREDGSCCDIEIAHLWQDLVSSPRFPAQKRCSAGIPGGDC
jgi:hypothetical protein